MTTREEYLGDGLYASFDGWQFKLRAPREGGDHEVYLDGQVLRSFLEYVERVKAEAAASSHDIRQAGES